MIWFREHDPAQLRLRFFKIAALEKGRGSPIGYFGVVGRQFLRLQVGNQSLVSMTGIFQGNGFIKRMSGFCGHRLRASSSTVLPHLHPVGAKHTGCCQRKERATEGQKGKSAVHSLSAGEGAKDGVSPAEEHAREGVENPVRERYRREIRVQIEQKTG
jgi:hypothetical protein